jgi:YidC/Oxa1 family membrane protein insertase
MSSSNNQTQIRFVLALTLSMLVLLGWSYLFPPPTPEQNNANSAQQTNTQTVDGNQTPTPQTQSEQQTTTVAETLDANPNRTLSIKTPLYEAKFDSKGAVVSSWVLLKNVSPKGERELLSVSSTKSNPQPLELVSADGKKLGLFPWQIVTGDASLDKLINEKNYQLVGVEENSPEAQVKLEGGQSKTVEFVFYDQANDLEVKKYLTFYGDSYVTDFKLKLTRNGQTVSNLKLIVGPAIGDQGIKFHNYSHVEPEAVSFVNNSVDRHTAAAITQHNGPTNILGEVDWAGVGDTYFAMAAVPAQKVQGLEFLGNKIEIETEPYHDGIFSWLFNSPKNKITKHLVTAFVPINADGSLTRIYAGTKDYFTLNEYNQRLNESVGRNVELDELINFGWYAWFRSIIKPITIPLLYALSWINSFTHSYGWAIIVFTLIFYSLLFPLRWYQSKSFKSAAKNAPKMKELQERTEALRKKGVALDDPRMREIQMEQLRLTKSAIPLGGCLPLLLQFPLLIALYTAITVSLDFRMTPFLWLPDLSAGDPIHILEFLFASSMWAAMAFTPTAPAMTPEQAMQQKMMTYMMPAMMLWLMWGQSSGLLVYWFFGNIIGFVQQLFINRWTKTPDDPTAETVSTAKKKVKTSLSTS